MWAVTDSNSERSLYKIYADCPCGILSHLASVNRLHAVNGLLSESVMLHGSCNTSGNGFLYGLIEERLWLGIARRTELRVRLRTVRDFSDSGVGTRRLVYALAARRHATQSSMVGIRFRPGFV